MLSRKIKDNLSKDAAEFLKDFGGFTDAEDRERSIRQDVINASFYVE